MDSSQQKSNKLSLIGAVQFLILTLIAMFFYPAGYSFWTDHFSTLGLIYTRSVPRIFNPISFILFVIAMILAGSLFIPFWLNISKSFDNNPKLRVFILICSIAGIVSSIFMILIAIFPADIFPYQHVFTAVVFFFSFTVAIFLHSILILITDDYPKLFSLVGFVSTVFGAIYVIGLLTGMFGGIFGAFDATIQKFAVYGFIIWMIIQVLKNEFTNEVKKS